MKNLQELPKLKDSISYLYIEHAIIEQNDTAIVAIKKEGKIPIPIAAILPAAGARDESYPCGDPGAL